MSERALILSLDGTDWQLLHLVPREWESRKVWEEEWSTRGGFPAVESWIRGTVPGDVISDAWEAELIPDPYVDMNSRACEWLSQRDWIYRKDFKVPELRPGERLRLCFEGLDFEGRVYLNGELLGEHSGMFTPFEFDVTTKVRTNTSNRLLVVVFHAPPVDVVQGQVGRTSEARLWKARFAYGWDWCTRLVPLGIWRSVRLVRTGPLILRDVWIRPVVDFAQWKAEITITASVESLSPNEETSIQARLLSGGKEVARASGAAGSSVRIDVPNPQFWWPNGMGDQPLYDVEVVAVSGGSVSDIYRTRTGLRDIRMVPNPGAPADVLPYTFQVNGRPLFIRGWNWVPLDHMYGRDQGDAAPPAGHPVSNRYQRLTEIAAHAHCNLLRVWGGGLLESEKFYNACDELGILVWQEFEHSSSGINNCPPTDKQYVDYVTTQARHWIPLRRNHPSLAAWCGGNELMDDAYAPLTDEHAALGALKSVVNELDPDRAWLPASPSGPEWSVSREKGGTGQMHDVHGPWKYDGPEGHYSLYNTVDPLLHSEFGVEGAANLGTLRRYLSEKYLWPPTEANPAWVHHGSWWLHLPLIEQLFGPVDTLEEFVEASQWLHAEGLRYAIEAHRRRTPYCSGTIPWQLNEAYPNAACTNAVDYLLNVKPAYWWIRQAYAPVSISLRYNRLTWEPGEEWEAEIWSVASYSQQGGCHWRAELFSLSGERLGTSHGSLDLEVEKPVRLAKLNQKLPHADSVLLVFLTLTSSDGELLASNDYLFSTASPPLKMLRNAPRVNLRVRSAGGHLLVHNESDVPALMVSVHAEGSSLPIAGYFSLPPSGSREVGGASSASEYNITCWNADVVD